MPHFATRLRRAARTVCCALALAGVLVAPALHAASGSAGPEHYRVAPAPAWVETLAVPALEAQGSHGDRVALLIDDQISLLDGVPERHYRRVWQVLAPGGITDAGDFSVEFDPSYESVVLNGVWIERDGRRQDRLADARIDALQREEGLESDLIDGLVTLHVVLSDIRVGDRVELAVTVKGANPALGGRFSQRYTLAFPLATRLRRVRLLAPVERPIEVRAGAQDVEQTKTEHGGQVDWRWQWRDRAPDRDEERVPSWHHEGPWVEFADRANWGDVVQWALPLYRIDSPRELAALADDLGLRADARSEEGALSAIRFVQDEVRYTGLELGAGAYRPSAPHVVAQRRYGDCKDKALLLVGLLRHLGFEAAPVLVDVDDLDHLHDRLPSAQAFDHVIVRFVVDGEDYWVDATNDHQRGSLASFAQADYGRGLLIAEGERDLRAIDVPRADAPGIDIEEVIDLRRKDGGLAKRGEYEIRTVYRGSEADDMRRRFASESVEEVGESFLSAVSDYYEDAEQVAPPTFSDDARANELTTVERYRLPGIWQPEDEGEGETASFYLSEIDRVLTQPKGVKRRAPWDLGRLRDVRQRLEVQLDGGWPKENQAPRVANDRLDYRGKIWSDGRTLRLEGRYRSLLRTVPARDVAQLRRDLDAVSEELGYSITYNEDAATPAVDWTRYLDARVVWLLLGLIALLFWVVWSGVVPSTAPALGMLFRPRATVRKGIDGRRVYLALALVVLAGLAQATLDSEVMMPWSQGAFAATVGAALVAAIVSLFGTALVSGIYAVVGRWFGGQGSVSDVFVAMGFSLVPIVALLPFGALLVGLYGPQAMIDPQQAHWAPLVLLLVCAILPLLAWYVCVSVAALAEAHRLPLGRTLVVWLSPLAVALVLVAVAMGVRSLGP